jgi:hypothetical protein
MPAGGMFGLWWKNCLGQWSVESVDCVESSVWTPMQWSVESVECGEFCLDTDGMMMEMGSYVWTQME